MTKKTKKMEWSGVVDIIDQNDEADYFNIGMIDMVATLRVGENEFEMLYQWEGKFFREMSFANTNEVDQLEPVVRQLAAACGVEHALDDDYIVSECDIPGNVECKKNATKALKTYVLEKYGRDAVVENF